MQAALDALWPYVEEVFRTSDVETRLVEAGVAVDPAETRAEVDAVLDEVLDRGHPDPPAAAADRDRRRPRRSPGAAHRAARARARRDAEPRPPTPRSDVVSEVAAWADDRVDARAHRAVAAVVDPEMPMLTLDDLGVVRGIEVDGDAVTVTITPTYSGCPAIEAMRDDLRASLGAAGYARVDVRTVLSPPWSTDWISEDGRRKLAEAGIAPPGPAGPREHRARGADPDPARDGRALPALWRRWHRGALPFRSDRMHRPAPLPVVPGALRARQGDLSGEHGRRHAGGAGLPRAARGRRRPALRRRRRRHLRRARRTARRVRLPTGSVPDAPPVRRRRRGAPLLLDLRPVRRRPAGGRAAGRLRGVLRVAGATGSSRATRSRSARPPARSPRTSSRARTTG